MSGNGGAMQKSDKVSRKHEAAIVGLLTHGTIGKAAAASQIGESTLRRWLKEPEFQDAYGRAKRELLDTTINRLRVIAADGADGLHKIVMDKNTPAGARVSAGRAILELLFRAVEVEDLAERLDKLEEAMGTDQ